MNPKANDGSEDDLRQGPQTRGTPAPVPPFSELFDDRCLV